MRATIETARPKPWQEGDLLALETANDYLGFSIFQIEGDYAYAILTKRAITEAVNGSAFSTTWLVRFGCYHRPEGDSFAYQYAPTNDRESWLGHCAKLIGSQSEADTAEVLAALD